MLWLLSGGGGFVGGVATSQTAGASEMAVVRGWSVQEATSNQKRRMSKQRLKRWTAGKDVVAGSHASSTPAKSFPSFPVWWGRVPPL